MGYRYESTEGQYSPVLRAVCTGLNVSVIGRANFFLNEFNVRQHNIGYTDDRSQFQVHTDERANGHSTQSSLVITHPSTNRGRRALTTVNESLS